MLVFRVPKTAVPPLVFLLFVPFGGDPLSLQCFSPELPVAGVKHTCLALTLSTSCCSDLSPCFMWWVRADTYLISVAVGWGGQLLTQLAQELVVESCPPCGSMGRREAWCGFGAAHTAEGNGASSLAWAGAEMLKLTYFSSFNKPVNELEDLISSLLRKRRVLSFKSRGTRRGLVLFQSALSLQCCSPNYIHSNRETVPARPLRISRYNESYLKQTQSCVFNRVSSTGCSEPRPCFVSALTLVCGYAGPRSASGPSVQLSVKRG